jgi:nicotinamidase-related amidase
MSKNDELRYGPPGETAVHLCVDMQRMFAEGTEWKMPWLDRVLPNILSITPPTQNFTRFIPARKKPGQGVGMWRHYYERWGSMTIDQLGAEMIELVPDLAKFVPPARTYDKHVYSPWTGSNLHQQLRSAGSDTVIITGGETDVCVLATMLGAIDWGFRIILVTDALCSSVDETHDAISASRSKPSPR